MGPATAPETLTVYNGTLYEFITMDTQACCTKTNPVSSHGSRKGTHGDSSTRCIQGGRPPIYRWLRASVKLSAISVLNLVEAPDDDVLWQDGFSAELPLEAEGGGARGNVVIHASEIVEHIRLAREEGRALLRLGLQRVVEVRVDVRDEHRLACDPHGVSEYAAATGGRHLVRRKHERDDIVAAREERGRGGWWCEARRDEVVRGEVM